MKVVFISKSDSVGGAAIATFRLVEALRAIHIDACMLVAHKGTDALFVHLAGPKWRIRLSFILERLRVALANKFSRSTLFALDIASFGLPLHRHPLVKNADVVCLGWFNQGLLSLQGLLKLRRKPLVWVMHDLWPMTGICHLPGKCKRYMASCGECPLLHSLRPLDISHRVFEKKRDYYRYVPNAMVAVSRWMQNVAEESPLLRHLDVEMIPNPYKLPPLPLRARSKDEVTIVMGAARIDEPGKGFPIIVEALKIIRSSNPDLADKIHLNTFGACRNPGIFNNLPVRHTHLGIVNGEKEVSDIYSRAHIVASPSHFESSGNTLVEGMAAGCIPVAFNNGGQSDIIIHEDNGFLVCYQPHYSSPLFTADAGKAFAEGLLWAIDHNTPEMRLHAHTHIADNFSYQVIAKKYRELFLDILG